MARMPEGWIILAENDGTNTWIKESRELVLCKDCRKRGLDNCPMEFYWDSHPADDICYCAMGERREEHAAD